MSKQSIKYKFSKRFLWGASSSGYQYEGAPASQWASWEKDNATSLAKAARYRMDSLPVWDEIKTDASRRDNYLSKAGNEHREKFVGDFDILSSLNLNAWRFSIEWSRLEPAEGQWDEAAIEHYHRYFDELKKRNIAPVVTLFHFTLPDWFEQKGGFVKNANIKYFVRFAQKVFGEYGAYLRHVVTMNEPEIYISKGWLDEAGWPPARRGDYISSTRVYLNLIKAHKLVYQAAKKRSRLIKIGLATNLSHHQPGDESLKSKINLRLKRYFNDELLLNRLRRHLDWIGVNYYFSDRYIGGKVQNLNQRVNDLGWEMLPSNIEGVVTRTYKKYGKPIIITENGVADRHDKYRRWWIAHTIDGLYRAIQNGARVEGYMHWSLLDNFEWDYGFWPRFGLVEVDYKTKERRIRASGIWFGKVVAKLRKG